MNLEDGDTFDGLVVHVGRLGLLTLERNTELATKTTNEEKEVERNEKEAIERRNGRKKRGSNLERRLVGLQLV